MHGDLWYKNAIIYNLSVDSFLDSDGDGCGDFRGLIRRLDYLQGLGITAVWLAPFYPSPRRDHGYDVADYYGVDPRFGTLGDFAEFTHACGERGMRVMIDLVINHSSDQHPWFQAALKDPRSRFKDYYIWSSEKPADADEGVVFPGVQTTTWTYSEAVGEYYFHKFHHFQPDLNIANPAVREEMFKIIGFWLQLGVSGFRMDAVPFLIAADGIDAKHPEPAFDFLRDIRAFAQWRSGDALLLAEANVDPAKAISYFGDDADRLHALFNFPVNQAVFYALASGETGLLCQALKDSHGIPAAAQWANFLRNHDELDLGRLPEPARQRVYDEFGPEPCMQLYDRGIRRRLAPMLGGDRQRLELAYSALLTLPGMVVLQYGDEIGMGDDLSQNEREAVRTPMQWSEEGLGGFTLAEQAVRPLIADGPFAYHKVNVASQRTDSNSLLNWLERAIRLRKELPEIGWADYELLDAPEGALALLYQWRGAVSLIAHNFGERELEWEISHPALQRDSELICLYTNKPCPRTDKGVRLKLGGRSYGWYKLGGLDDLRGVMGGPR